MMGLWSMSFLQKTELVSLVIRVTLPTLFLMRVAASLVRLTWNVREDFRSWAAPWKANRTVEQNCPQVLEEEM